MLFCAHCGNILLVESAQQGLRFYCQTCPYVHLVAHAHRKVAHLVRKQVEPVLDVDSQWKNAPEADHPCSACTQTKAKYTQIQIRSADEPATNFYKCAWRGARRFAFFFFFFCSHPRARPLQAAPAATLTRSEEENWRCPFRPPPPSRRARGGAVRAAAARA